MIKIAVYHEAESISQSIKQIIEEHMAQQDVEADAFTTGREIYENAMKKRYDIILIDIAMEPGAETGIEISKQIKSVYPDVLIIFMTHATGYERKLLDYQPFRLIAKPFSDKELFFILDKAIRKVNGLENQFFFFKDKGIGHKKNLKDIIYFCSSYSFVEVVCLRETGKFRGKINAIEEDLAALSNDFVRPSKNFLVNRKHITSYSSREVVMADGKKISVSRKYREKFLAALNG